MKHCEDCDMSFKSAYSLKSHKLTEHGDGKAFKCTVCPAMFSIRYEYFPKNSKSFHKHPFISAITCLINGQGLIKGQGLNFSKF